MGVIQGSTDLKQVKMVLLRAYSLSVVLLLSTKCISSQPVQNDPSKNAQTEKISTNQNETDAQHDLISEDSEDTKSGTSNLFGPVVFIGVIAALGLILVMSFKKRNVSQKTSKTSKQYRAPTEDEETVTLTGHPQIIPRRVPTKGSLPRLLSKDSDADNDEELLSMIDKETKMEKLDLWTNLNGNVTTQNNTPTETKEHPRFSLY